MGSPAAGSIVLVPFPFSDLSQTKLRPAVVLAHIGRRDMILCQVTSQAYGDRLAIALDDASFAQGSLSRQSYVRPGKLFTAHETLIVSQPARLRTEALSRIVDVIVSILKSVEKA